MWLLLAGLIIFFAAHLSPGVLGLRETLIARLGEKRFTGLYVATSVLGMVTIVAGKGTADYTGVYFPPIWARPAVLLIMAAAFVMLAALLIPSNIRRFTRHPMLWGVALWSAAHLLANGDLASITLFGSFGAYALISMWSLNKRGAQRSTIHYSRWQDALTVAGGLGTYAIILALHPYLFGVPALF